MPIDSRIPLSVETPNFKNSPFEILAQWQQVRQQRDAARQAQEIRQTQLDDRKAAQQNTRILAEAYRQALDPTTGDTNPQALATFLSNHGLGPQVPDILKGFQESDAAKQNAKTAKIKADEAEMGYFKTLAGNIVASEFNPIVIEGALSHAEEAGHDVKDARKLFENDPEKFKTFVTNINTPKPAPAPFTLGPGQQRFDPGNPVPTASVPPNPTAPVHVEQKTLLYKGKPTLANYNPVTGKTMLPTGEDISASVSPVPTASQDAANTAAQPPKEIKEGTPAFTVAQDLAYGKLTMQQFRSLVAYTRDVNMKLGLYAKAQELNPNFNPAEFEMGFKLASNPKVQQQLASLDNVRMGVNDLIAASDAAARSGATVLNKFVNPAGIAVGGKKYSNLRTARIAFADELSGALGYGSATDMSREMGFNMADDNLSPENFQSAIQDIVMPFVARKRKSMLDQMGIYGREGMNPAAAAEKNPGTASVALPPRDQRKAGVTHATINGVDRVWNGTGWALP